MQESAEVAASPALGSERDSTNALIAIYEENGRVSQTFWEWRHKVMTRFFAGIAGIVVAAGWMFDKAPQLRPRIFVLLAIGSAFCFISYVLDRVNMKILRNCYKVGKSLEEKLSSQSGAYKCIHDNYSRVQYHHTLRVMYIGAGILLLGVSVWAKIYLK